MQKSFLTMLFMALFCISILSADEKVTLTDDIQESVRSGNLDRNTWEDFIEPHTEEDRGKLLLYLFNFYTYYLEQENGTPQNEVDELFLDLPLEKKQLLVLGAAVNDLYTSSTDLLYKDLLENRENLTEFQTGISQAYCKVYSSRKRIATNKKLSRNQWDLTATEIIESQEIVPLVFIQEDLHKALKKSGRKEEQYFWDLYNYLDTYPPSFFRNLQYRIRALFLGKKVSYRMLRERAWDRLKRDIILARQYNPFPDFPSFNKEYNMYSSSKGEEISFKPDNKNYMVILMFSTDCSHCTYYFKTLKKMEKEWFKENKEIKLYAVGSEYFKEKEEFISKTTQYGKKKRIDHTFLYDFSYDFYRDYTISNVPVILIFSPEGEFLRAIQTGREGHLKTKLDYLINDLINKRS